MSGTEPKSQSNIPLREERIFSKDWVLLNPFPNYLLLNFYYLKKKKTPRCLTKKLNQPAYWYGTESDRMTSMQKRSFSKDHICKNKIFAWTKWKNQTILIMRKQHCCLNPYWFLSLSLYLLFLSLSPSNCFSSQAFFPLTSYSVLQFFLQLFSFFLSLLNILPFTAFIMNEPPMKASVWNQEYKGFS